jgi:hypothetical protein
MFHDDFQSSCHTLRVEGISPNGKWVDKWNGDWQAGVKSINDSNFFYEIPKYSARADETSLIVSTQKFSVHALVTGSSLLSQHSTYARNCWKNDVTNLYLSMKPVRLPLMNYEVILITIWELVRRK